MKDKIDVVSAIETLEKISISDWEKIRDRIEMDIQKYKTKEEVLARIQELNSLYANDKEEINVLMKRMFQTTTELDILMKRFYIVVDGVEEVQADASTR